MYWRSYSLSRPNNPQKIDQEIYHMVVAQLQQHVVAKNSKTSLETASADGKTLVPVSEMGRITCDMEFRFMLHRHWSLYEVRVRLCLHFSVSHDSDADNPLLSEHTYAECENGDLIL